MSELTEKIRRLRWALPWSSALLLALLFVPLDLSWLAWIVLGDLLVFLYLCPNWKEAALGGLAVGAIFYGSCFFWINHLDKWGGPWAYVGWAGLTLTLAALIAVWAVFAFWTYKRLSAWQKIFFPALAWVTIEWFRSSLGSFGLSLYSLGYTQAKVLPLLQFASFAQVFGLSFLIIWCNSTLAYYFMVFLEGEGDFRKVLAKWQPAVLFAAILLSVYVTGAGKIAELKTAAAGQAKLKIAVVQASVPQELKMTAARDEEIFQKHLRMTRSLAQDKPDLIVWPETVSVRWWQEGRQVAELARQLKTNLLVGLVHQVGPKFYNTLALIDAQGRLVGIYDKVRLVPFGEYVPFRDLIGWAFRGSEFLTGEYSAAPGPKVLDLGNIKIGPMICFESTFPQAARWLKNHGADFLTVSSNDAWFGRDFIIQHHLTNSIFRAVETRLWLVQAANTGLSAIVAPWGEVAAVTEVNQAVTLSGNIALPKY